MNEPDTQKLVALLKELKPGFLPYDIFNEIARIMALPIIEFVPLRLNNGEVEVLLLPRDPDDKFWSDKLHTPGTVIRATDIDDSGIQKAFDRLVKEELHGSAVGEPHFVFNYAYKDKRGMSQAQVFWLEVLGQPKVGEFYKASDLPANLVDPQHKFIPEAVKSFKLFKQTN